jgi:murein DD-endopeptidase MepM/ murein hydrolase activator NlpD
VATAPSSPERNTGYGRVATRAGDGLPFPPPRAQRRVRADEKSHVIVVLRATRDHQPTRVRRRTALAVVVAMAAAVLVGPAAHAQPDEGAAEQAAREIAAAQDRANGAAAKWSQAEADLSRLQDEAAQLTQERDALQAQVDALQAAVSQAAAERFMSSGSAGIPILTSYGQPLDQLSAAELGRVVSGTADDAFDQFAVSQRDLQRKADDLAAKQAEVQHQQEKYEALSTAAAAEVEHLKEVEQKRLADERVRLALEAQRREEQRRLAEQQAAEAAQRAAQEAQRAAEQQRAAALQAQQEQAAQGAAALAASDTAQPPAPDAGGQGGGAASAPADPGMICPVAGPSAYSDTWGAPRPGGRRHEGVDMIAPKGTPLVAVANGTVTRRRQNSNGALTVGLDADNGTHYFYGHLSAYAGSEGRVSQGDVIGYVGNTGTTVNHLHFEVHPGGGGPVDPTPYVRNAGC